MRRYSKSENLKKLYPSYAELWHTTKNGSLRPSDLTPGSERIVWWQCPYGHEYQRHTANQIRSKGRCPFCTNQTVGSENNFAHKYPTLIADWHPEKNGDLLPDHVVPGSQIKVWWRCPEGHDYHRHPYGQVKFAGRCPVCFGYKAGAGKTLADALPELALQWHPNKNNGLHPSDVRPQSNMSVWWICGAGHEFKTVISKRSAGSMCPFCCGRVASPDDNLLVRFPEIAGQWHPTKNGEMEPSQVRHGSDRKVWWLCPSGHEYQATILNRSNGLTCRRCNPQSSKMEIFLYCELSHIFEKVEWGVRFGRLEADIFIPDYNIVVEMDGSYWHSNKMEKDREKNDFFSSKGISVFRVREGDLPMISERDVSCPEWECDAYTVCDLIRSMRRFRKFDIGTDQRMRAYLSNQEQMNDELYQSMIKDIYFGGALRSAFRKHTDQLGLPF